MSTAIELPPLPIGVVVPDTADELLDQSDDGERLVVELIGSQRRRFGRERKLVIAFGVGRIKRGRGLVELSVAERGETRHFRVLAPARYFGEYDYIPPHAFVVCPGDVVKLTVHLEGL